VALKTPMDVVTPESNMESHYHEALRYMWDSKSDEGGEMMDVPTAGNHRISMDIYDNKSSKSFEIDLVLNNADLPNLRINNEGLLFGQMKAQIQAQEKSIIDHLQELMTSLESGHYGSMTVPTAPPTKAIVCECGKEKHGFAKHSDWCDIKDNK
jgi:hypothetical protein